jgi:hypothetical protein
MLDKRGGRTSGLGVEFDVYWLSPEEVEHLEAIATRFAHHLRYHVVK